MLLNRRDGDSVPGYRVRRWSPTRRAQARATLPFQGRASPMARCLEAATRAPLAPPLPACGERSDSERSEGIRVRGRSRESELADKPPHPICFASQGLRPQIDLSPHAGRGGAKWLCRAPDDDGAALAASQIPDIAALIRATGRAWCESARVATAS